MHHEAVEVLAIEMHCRYLWFSLTSLIERDQSDVEERLNSQILSYDASSEEDHDWNLREHDDRFWYFFLLFLELDERIFLWD